jgi:nucleoid-associated protein YgaU
MGFFDKKEDPPKKKADFSSVKSGGSSAPAPAPPAVPAGKPKADFSNVKSGASSTAPAPEMVYVVKSGDSLSKIAKRVYGDARKWRMIYEANREVVGPNPDLIHPGQKLVLPQD